MNALMPINKAYKKVDFIIYFAAAQLIIKKGIIDYHYLRQKINTEKFNIPNKDYKTLKGLQYIYDKVEKIING